MRGERREYRPLRSLLSASTDPVEVAGAYRRLGFEKIYVADLDAIEGGRPSLGLYGRLRVGVGPGLMVDAGVDDLEKAREVLEAGASEAIIGTETLRRLDFVGRAVESLGGSRVIVSLDLREGRVMSPARDVGAMDPALLATELEALAVERIIVLDLARVGTGRGVDTAVIRRILEGSGVDVSTGGGVRGLDDLKALRDMGVSGALVATALHTGRLTVEVLRSAGFL